MNMSHTTGRMSLLLAGISLVIFLPWTATLAQDAQSEASEEERLRVIAAYDAAVAEGDLTGGVRHVLEFTEKSLGENAPETVKLTHRYGFLLLQDGEYRDATRVLRTALKRSNAAFGKSGGDAFEINMNLAFSYSKWSQSLSARMKYFDRALEILREKGQRETTLYVTTLINSVVNLMDNDGLSGSTSTELVDNFDYYDGDEAFLQLDYSYDNHFYKADKYLAEAAELAEKLEHEDEYLAAKIAIAQAKLNVLETADLAAVPAGVRGRITTRTVRKRNGVEEDRLTQAIAKLREDIEANGIFLDAANKGLMEIAWMDKDRSRMDAMCANGTLNSAADYSRDRLYRIAEDGSVLAPNFSFRVPSNIFKPVVRRGEPPKDKDGNPIKQPHFIPVCINGELMAALVNAPRVIIEEFE